ncbi:tetratricopeptide repeat protein, partial [Micromonospora zhanjiangensis]
MSQPPHLPSVQRQAQGMANAGDSAGARRLLTLAIEAARPAYGEDHQEVLATAHLLARMHRAADDPVAARRVLEEAFAAGQRRWGDADPLLLAISFELAGVAEELGNRHEARKAFTRVAMHGPTVFGDDDWTVRTAREYLGQPQPVSGLGPQPEPPTAPIVLPAQAPRPGATTPPGPP